eukprot:TRINITY_DN30978_c0_g1_i1.p1 TRINITY_DN30978_c0_g1~~TRINITY_DN30978_c0_g1_i1.p1  ORF type:complete len:426 (+),score=156.76 TRINITY_DN30978_c0_g1_i1:84-1361(+)
MLARRKWISFPSVEIPEFINPWNNQKHTFYRIVVKDGPETWSIFKRYAHFTELHNQLLELPNREPNLSVVCPVLPPKQSIFDWRFHADAGKFLDGRRRMLEQYLQAIVAQPQLLQSSEVRSFLEPEDGTQAPTKRSPELFLLPPPPQTLRLPHVIVVVDGDAELAAAAAKSPSAAPGGVDDDVGERLEVRTLSSGSSAGRSNGTEEAYDVLALLSEMQHALETLWLVRTELDATPDTSQKFERLEVRRARVDTSVGVLGQQAAIVERIVAADAFTAQTVGSSSGSSELAVYFGLCRRQVQRALDWIAQVDHELFEQIFVLRSLEHQQQYPPASWSDVAVSSLPTAANGCGSLDLLSTATSADLLPAATDCGSLASSVDSWQQQHAEFGATVSDRVHQRSDGLDLLSCLLPSPVPSSTDPNSRDLD